MKQKTNKMLIFTSLAAYFTYFIHGIGASILGQYKPEFAAAWGAKTLADGTLDVSMVVSVIAALGLGRLISLPFSGPLSDKYGRRLSGIIGVLCYVAYFFGMANSTSMAMGYAFAVIGGIANSFLDTCVSPTCMEIYVNNPSVANLFTKFSICLSQFLLPFLIGIVASANMSYKTIFIVAGIAIFIDGILILILPFPERKKAAEAKADKIRTQDFSGSDRSNPDRIYKFFHLYAVAELQPGACTFLWNVRSIQDPVSVCTGNRSCDPCNRSLY